MEQNNPIQKNDKLNINNIIFDKGDFTENEHRLFLEAFIIYDKNYQEMSEYIKNKYYSDIILYSKKLTKYLQQKYQKKENNSSIIIEKAKISEYSNEELEEYIYNNYCLPIKNSENSNLVDEYFIDDNKSMLGLNNNKKIFYIQKYPKNKTLIEKNINNNNNIEITIQNIVDDKESKKKIIHKLLNENCKEVNLTKMEELTKMNEIIQIINKTENNNNLNHGLSDDSSNKTNSYITNEIKNQNKSNDINDNNNLGKKRNMNFISFFDEKEKIEKNDFINEINSSNRIYFNNMNNINNNINNNNINDDNNLFPNEKFINNNNNISINLSNNFIPNHSFQFNQINDNFLNNNMNLNSNIHSNDINENPLSYFFQRNNSSNLNQFIPQQLGLMPPPIFNLPFPILGITIPNINIPEVNNQNFHNSINIPKYESNSNLMNLMNFGNNFNENTLYYNNIQPGIDHKS